MGQLPDEVSPQDAGSGVVPGAAVAGKEGDGAQGVLFDLPSASPAPAPAVGYRGPTACAAAGITYRQLDYWARTGLVEPSIRGAAGSGTQRLYAFQDILVLKVVKSLLDTGVSLQNIRKAVAHLREHGVEDLARITLMSDGASVYECTSPDEVADLLQGGQGVFGIALGSVVRDVEGSLALLPSVPQEPAEDDQLADSGSGLDSDSSSGPSTATESTAGAGADELARRRQGRHTA